MFKSTLFTSAALLCLTLTIQAQQTRVNVIIENLAPTNGTSQTPIWVGFHDGGFDSYTPGLLASDLPIPGSVALERLAEDGNTSFISSDFITLGSGTQQATLAGPAGPLGPGDRTSQSFLLFGGSPLDRYFSYASMILPSNDAFVANGNPLAHPVFDANGGFVAQDFFVSGPGAARDAGTEVNDEIPANTAFFGQMAPNTGVTESIPVAIHQGLMARGQGGILDDARFRFADFSTDGYPFLRFGFRAAPAILDTRVYATILSGANEVPPVQTPAIGIIGLSLTDQGTKLNFNVITLGLENLIFGHLHLGAAGQNGPVVATIIPNRGPASGGGGFDSFTGSVVSADLTGPLADFPLDELVRQIELDNVYVNLHTDDGQPGPSSGPGDVLSGELRGQVSLF